jgi:hypothetical protein
MTEAGICAATTILSAKLTSVMPFGNKQGRHGAAAALVAIAPKD